MTQKKQAAVVLTMLVLALVAVNTVAMPELHTFLKVGTMDSMYATGKTVGSALGTAFGSPIMEFIGVVLFLA